MNTYMSSCSADMRSHTVGYTHTHPLPAILQQSSPHYPGDVTQATCTVKALSYVARNTDAHIHTKHFAIWDSFPSI